MFKKFILAAILPIVFTACGGGGSDSGGAQNNVTFCIAEEIRRDILGLPERILVNTCDFPVNLGRGIVSIRFVDTLQPGESVLFLVGGYIACRPPSIPIDKDDSPGGRDFDCSE